MSFFNNSAILVCCLAFLIGCTNNNKGQKEIIRKVKIESVQQADSLTVKQYPGLIKEAGEVNLAFRVAGPIQKILIKEGSYIKEGQLVARIDPRDYKVQLDAVQAQYEQVKAEADRVIELHSRESVAGNDYDKAVSGLKMIEAKLNNARDQLADTRLLAPFSGYIQKVNFLENEMINAGMPVASLIDVRQLFAEVEIPVSLYVKRENILSYSGVQSTVSDEPFPLELLSYRKKAGNKQMYKVQLRLTPASQPQLAPGMDVLVNIIQKNNENLQACVPLSALFNEGGKTYVWIYQPEGRVQKREVITGKLAGDGRIRIISGVQISEKVVVAGVNNLFVDEKVEVLESVSETNVGGIL
jgi:RND family efflux transporter MFP subunit